MMNKSTMWHHYNMQLSSDVQYVVYYISDVAYDLAVDKVFLTGNNFTECLLVMHYYDFFYSKNRYTDVPPHCYKMIAQPQQYWRLGLDGLQAVLKRNRKKILRNTFQLAHFWTMKNSKFQIMKSEQELVLIYVN